MKGRLSIYLALCWDLVLQTLTWTSATGCDRRVSGDRSRLMGVKGEGRNINAPHWPVFIVSGSFQSFIGLSPLYSELRRNLNKPRRELSLKQQKCFLLLKLVDYARASTLT